MMRFLILLLGLVGLAVAKGTTVQDTGAVANNNAYDVVPAQTLDLKAHLQAIPQQSEVLISALHALDTYQRSPSCHRAAASVLIDSCRLLETGTDEDFEHLALIKSTFAARLAVCELVEAHASVPDQCKIMLLKKDDKKTSGFNPFRRAQTVSPLNTTFYDAVDDKAAGKCLTALESRPQWWTSYSNARQNAIPICHASRLEMDRDEALRIQVLITGLSKDLGEEMDNILRTNANRQVDFANAVKKLQEDLILDMHYVSSAAITKITADMGDLLATIKKDVKGAVNEVFHGPIADTVQAISLLSKEVTTNSASLSNAHARSSKEHQEAAEKLKLGLEALHATHITQLVTSLQAVQKDFDASRLTAVDLYKRQQDNSEWLARLEEAMLSIQAGFSQMVVFQQDFYENHTDLMASVKSTMSGHQSAMTRLAAQVDGLALKIEEKTAQVGSWAGVSEAAGLPALCGVLVGASLGFGGLLGGLVAVPVLFLGWLAHMALVESHDVLACALRAMWAMPALCAGGLPWMVVVWLVAVLVRRVSSGVALA